MDEKFYGLWNAVKKEFQFGIKEPSKRKAEKKAIEKIGKYWKWRFEIREIKQNSKIQPSYQNITKEELRNFCDEYGLYVTIKIGYKRVDYQKMISAEQGRMIEMNKSKIIAILEKQGKVRECPTVKMHSEKKLK